MLLGPSLAVSGVLFTLGVLGVLLRRNAIVIFMCVELMLNAANLAFVAFAQQLGVAGQIFVFFMLVLVLADNFLLLYLGWEGVGLCSYLLIGFWFEKKSAADAGKKAFIVNRIGDCGFILGILLAFFSMVVAAAEVVVGLAIIVNVYRRRASASVDDVSMLRG